LQIIVTCIFANFEKFCGVDPDTAGFSTFINNVRWDLPEVPWDFNAHPFDCKTQTSIDVPLRMSAYIPVE
jgi:hypothetical protein